VQVGFQTGIPEVFFPELRLRGISIFRFSRADEISPEAQAVFYRANFKLDVQALGQLPHCSLAALVSTGTDNTDLEALRARGIRFVSGDGANAQAVCDYVIQALLHSDFDPSRHSVGVVGAGRVGSRVLKFLRQNKIRSAFYDPYLAQKGSLEEVLACDFVTFHVPLTNETQGMLDANYFAPVSKQVKIIQTARGQIWNKEFYANLHEHRHISLLAEDVFPVEPPPPKTIGRAQFTTPHIAGYSTRGRLGGLMKGLKALLPELNLEASVPQGKAWFLAAESDKFLSAPDNFNAIRDNYPWRKELSEYDASEQTDFFNQCPRANELSIFS